MVRQAHHERLGKARHRHARYTPPRGGMSMAHATETAAGGYIGQSVLRKEDPRLLRGRGLFVGDVHLPGMVHAAFLRSPYAHARILKVDVSRARAMPGVLAAI